jgi:hypothetical protein
MKSLLRLDPYLISGFTNGFFMGLLNPFFISLILSQLSVRVLSAGTFLLSGLPFLLGVLFENKKLFDKLFKFLPLIMILEILGFIALIFLYSISIPGYYIASMALCGIFGTGITYLMQKVRDIRYQNDRAAFERRHMMSDGLGYLLGSLLVFLGLVNITNIVVLLILAAIHGLIVDILCFIARHTSGQIL